MTTTLTERQQANAAVLQRMAAAVNRGDMRAAVEDFAENGILEDATGALPWGEISRGKEEIQAAFEKTFRFIPGAQLTDIEQVVQDDKIVIEYTVVGPPGSSIAFRACDCFDFNEDSKVLRKSIYAKELPLQEKLRIMLWGLKTKLQKKSLFLLPSKG